MVHAHIDFVLLKDIWCDHVVISKVRLCSLLDQGGMFEQSALRGLQAAFYPQLSDSMLRRRR